MTYSAGKTSTFGLCMLAYCLGPVTLWAQPKGSIELGFQEKDSGTQVACRIKILDSQGRPQRNRNSLFVRGWNLIEGPLQYTARADTYTYQVFHGPQFSAAAGGFTLSARSSAVETVTLPRHADLARENWHAGDLLSHVPPKETLRWLPAEDLCMAAVVSTQISQQPVQVNAVQPQPADEPVLRSVGHDRWVDSTSFHDSRTGSGLTFHHWLPPTQVPDALPSSRLLVMAKEAPREAGDLPVHAEIQRLWARDVPVWLASQRIDSIQILSDHLTADGAGAATFEPLLEPDPGRYRGPQRAGRLVENLYWQVLECGLRIPPTAGSGFGASPSPLGYHRVYAFTPTLSAQTWWQAIRDGQTFVTSGPLLRAKVNGEQPGKVFSAAAGQAIPIDIAIQLTVAEPVEYLDVIFNGEKIYQARLDEYARQGGRIPAQTIRESGWLVIRVVSERSDTYRLATTAPYYFEIGGQPRISRSAVEFFRTWLGKCNQQIADLDAATQAAYAPYSRSADEFWQKRLSAATVD